MKLLNAPTIAITTSPQNISIPLYRSQETPPLSNDIASGQMAASGTYVLSGSHTLEGPVIIAPYSGAVDKMVIRFLYRAELVVDNEAGKYVSFFGYIIPSNLATKRAIVECYFNGSTGHWEISYYPDFAESAFIEGENLTDESVTEEKLADGSLAPRTFQDNSIPESAILNNSIPTRSFKEQSIPNTAIQDFSIGRQKIGGHQITNDKIGLMEPGSVKVGGDGWAPEDVQMNTPGAGSVLIAQGYGLKPASKQIIHQGTLTKDGLFYINPGAVTNQNMGTYSVSPEKVDDTMASDFIEVLVDFADASRNRRRMAYKGAVWAIWGSVEKTIVGDGYITIKNESDTIIGVINVLDGQLKDVTSYSTTIGNGEFNKFDTLKFECSGSSAGKVALSVICVKRP